MKAVAMVSVVAALALAGGCDAEPAKESAKAAPEAPTAASANAATGAPSSAAASAASGAPVALTAEQEKEARRVVVNDCLACHAEALLEQQRLTPKQWAAVVKKMAGWGSQVEAGSVDALVAFLSARYGTSAEPYSLPSVNAAAAASALAQTPDGPFGGGDAAKGAALYREACASCHGDGGQGAAIGVRLADRPGLFRAADFAAIVRKGRGRMPGYAMYKDEDIGALLAYLRSLGPA